MCFTLHDYLHLEGLYGGLSAEGERSSMVENAPAAFEHDRQRRVMGTIRGIVPREVSIRGIR